MFYKNLVHKKRVRISGHGVLTLSWLLAVNLWKVRNIELQNFWNGYYTFFILFNSVVSVYSISLNKKCPVHSIAMWLKSVHGFSLNHEGIIENQILSVNDLQFKNNSSHFSINARMKIRFNFLAVTQSSVVHPLFWRSLYRASLLRRSLFRTFAIFYI